MVIRKVDKKNRFISIFDTETGKYVRTGLIDKDGKDTGVDPFMTVFPELLDIGIMGHCIHASKGLCYESGIQCYQDGKNVKRDNMKLDDFKKIIDECKGKTFQVALGGRGDPNHHENFEEILKYCRQNNIVPNFTTSGLGLTAEMVGLCKQYCGAVAVSWHNQSYTYDAITALIDAGVKTNIHYVLGKSSIKDACERLEKKDFPKGINAIVFLLHKPVGLGKVDNMLSMDDPDLKRFMKLVDGKDYDFKIGFDSCTVPGILNMTSHINRDSVDTCEGARWSAYISSDMQMMPCSFDNQELRWAYDISNDTIQHAWDSPQFEDFRNHFRNSCPGCDHQCECRGGCPIKPQIVLCNSDKLNQYNK